MRSPQREIELLERRLLSERPNDELLRRYHRAAIEAGAIGAARQLFETLFRRHADNQTIGGLFIALSLELQDHERALWGIRRLLALNTPEDHLLDAALAVLAQRSAGGTTPKLISPQISLCMIVKNEAHCLGRSLYHARELADDLVVVDTGSTDRSVDIARLFDARIFSFAWCQDFAAARNFALKYAQGRWILILDADEAIAAQDIKFVRRLTTENECTRIAFSLETRNYCHKANIIGWHANDGSYGRMESGLGWFGSNKVRIFPRREDIRFHFPVHERVEPSLKSAGYKILPCSVPVHHYGHLDEATNRRKALAYYELGCKKIEQMRNDLPALRELAVQAGQLEYWTEAIRLWELLLNLKPDFVEAHINIANAHWQLGAYQKALKAARTASDYEPGHPQAIYNVAISQLFIGESAAAAQKLSELLERQPDYLPALFMSAAALDITGRTQEASEQWVSVAAKIPAPALRLAKQDLAQRLACSGRTRDASLIEADAGRLE